MEPSSPDNPQYNPQQASQYPPLIPEVPLTTPVQHFQHVPSSTNQIPSQPVNYQSYPPTHVNPSPQPYGMAPQPYSPPTHIRDSQLTFGPQVLYCQRCNAHVVSKTQETTGRFVYYNCVGLCSVGCLLCCIIPFFIPICKDVEHHCMNCNNYLGTKKLL